MLQSTRSRAAERNSS